MSPLRFVPLVVLAACASASQQAPKGTAWNQVAAAPDAREADDEGSDPGPVPIAADDPQRGDRDAAVTWVVFGDLTSEETRATLANAFAIQGELGASNVRVAWKDFPSASAGSRVAAELGHLVMVRGGSDAFFAFADAVFADQARLRDAEEPAFARAIAAARVDARTVARSASGGEAERKLDGDRELAARLAVTRAPTSFVNGVVFRAGEPVDKLRGFVAAQIDEAAALVAKGTPKRRVSAFLAEQQYQDVATTPSRMPELDPRAWAIPIDNAPVRGAKDALVTIVVFADFQCPYCAKAQRVLNELPSLYPDKLRLVFKNQPLDFHPRSEPAAELALEARAEQGDAGFWRVHDALMSDPGHLDDNDLLAIARSVGLDRNKVSEAISKHTHRREIDDDIDVASDFDANGTPTFFINGRRVVGAQPLSAFRSVIDEELAKAQKLVTAGTPSDKVYDFILKTASKAPPPEKKSVGAPPSDAPALGDAHAKVTMQVFADFECPFCKRSDGLLGDLEKEFHGQLRIVWRDLPLPMHPDAEIDAEACVEARAQKGEKGFWQMHDLLMQGQSTRGGQSFDAILGYGANIGLDVPRLSNALKTGARRERVEQDLEDAKKAGISSTPSFVINGYYLKGAQPVAKFRRLVKRAIAEAP